MASKKDDDEQHHTEEEVEETESDDPVDKEREVRERFSKMKTESKMKGRQLHKHSVFLQDEISKIDESREKACDQVKKQIYHICEKVKQMGETITDDINKIGKDEISKLTKLEEDDDKMKSKMEEWRDNADGILQHKSIITAVDNDKLTDLQTKTDYDISTNLETPVVRPPYFYMGEIDVDSIKQLLGEVETTPILELEPKSRTTFTSSFRFNPKKHDKVYYSDEVIIRGLPWCVRVKRDPSMNLCIYLELRNVYDETIKTVTVIYTVKVLNIKDESKAHVKEQTVTFSPGKDWFRMVKFENLNKLLVAENGFTDDGKTITVEITVEITDIEQ